MADDFKGKFYRVMKLIQILNTPPGRTIKQLINDLGSSSSTIYRDIKDLRKLGYPVKEEKERHFLKFTYNKRKDKNTLETEENLYLQEILQQHAGNSNLAKSILHKFDLNLHLIPLADSLPHLHVTQMVQLAMYGIQMGKCLKLVGYKSLTSDNVRDRIIEPLDVTQDRKYLIGWDKEQNDQRQFKIIRIQDIEFIEEKVNPKRIASPMDIFGLTGDAWLSVQMELSSLAHNLLVEEFPYSTSFIRNRGDKILFDSIVRNWKGIGRFVLGLPGEIKIIAPDDFKNYLKNRIEAFSDSQ